MSLRATQRSWSGIHLLEDKPPPFGLICLTFLDLLSPAFCSCSNKIRSIATGDVDGDGYPDVVVTFEWTDLVTWFRNTDGMGDFSTGIDIATDADGAAWAELADIDGDGDLDVVSASYADGMLACCIYRPLYAVPRIRSCPPTT